MAEGRTQPAVPCLLGCLLPGAGHLYLGRWGRALVFLGAITTLFVLGVAMQARLEINQGLEDPLALLFGIAQMAAGAPYLLARLLAYGAGNVQAVTFEYGNTFTAVSGLLNILVVLDAYDLAVGRKA